MIDIQVCIIGYGYGYGYGEVATVSSAVLGTETESSAALTSDDWTLLDTNYRGRFYAQEYPTWARLVGLLPSVGWQRVDCSETLREYFTGMVVHLISHRIAIITILLTFATLLAGCAGSDMTGSLAHRVAAWNKGSLFTQARATLENDNRRISTLQAKHDNLAIKTACEVLGIDARRANSYLPTPDQTLTDLLHTAYRDEYTASLQCYKGA
ncbi:MAG: hypothetical protein ACYDGY_06785, partial [Acidimicrobiales bacterium]